MDELTILKNLKYIFLSQKYERGDSITCNLDYILSLMGAAILPFVDDLKPASDDIHARMGSMSQIHSLMKKSFTSKDRQRLLTLNLLSLIDYLQENWIPTLPSIQKSKLAKDFSLIKETDENGNVTLKGNDIVYQSILSQGYIDMGDIYGILDTLEISSTTTKPVIDNSITGNETSTEERKNKQKIETKDLENFWSRCIYDHDKFSNFMPLVWKLKIPEPDYRELKRLLKQSIATLSNARQRREFLELHAKKLFVYVAEWYRREYSGKNTNALDDIGFWAKAQDIWEKCPKEYENHIYASSNTAWLYSMYVMGGIPVKYESRGLDSFYDGIMSAINGEYESLPDDIVFNNIAFQQSLTESDGSLNAFVTSILTGDMPFSDTDLQTDDVKAFIERVEQGRKRKQFDKFWLEWIVTYNQYASLMDRRLIIHLRPEDLGRNHKIIKYERLQKWGITNPEDLPNFTIKVRFNQDKDTDGYTALRFSNKFNGVFVAWGAEESIEIPSEYIPDSYIYKVQLSLCCKQDGEPKEYDIPIKSGAKSYLQLYPNGNPNEWSSAVARGNISAVVFENKWSVRDNQNSICKFFGESEYADEYNWLTFDDQITLIDTNEQTVVLNRKGDAMSLEVSRFANAIAYPENGLFEYITTETDEKGEVITLSKQMPVLFGLHNLLVKKTDEMGNTQWPDTKGLTFEYKYPQDVRFSVWDKSILPSQGPLRIRVSDNADSASIDVYYVPNRLEKRNNKPLSPVRRNLELNSQYVTFATGTKVYSLTLKTSKSNDLKFEDPSTVDKYASSTIFYLGTPESYLKLPVFRAHYRKELLFHDKTINVKNDRSHCFNADELFKEHLAVKIIDENGESYDINSAHITYRKWEEGWDPRHLKISKKFYPQYAFYFWDMNSNHEPERIAPIYDNETEILAMPEVYLSRKGILFQSLINGLTPPQYRACIHQGNKAYPTSDAKDLKYKCFDLAMEHNIYFGTFEILKELIKTQGDMADNVPIEFFLSYAKQHNYQLTKHEFHAFHRMAEEFRFDWLFLCRGLWIRHTKDPNDRRMATLLFKNNPRIQRKSSFERRAYKLLTESYWQEWKPYADWNVNARSDQGACLCFMRINNRSDHAKYHFTGDVRSEKMVTRVLDYLFNDSQAFQSIVQTINDKQLTKINTL